VRQIEIRTFGKIKRAVRNAAHDASHAAARRG
jgi:RNA polymerase sigma-32 factor